MKKILFFVLIPFLLFSSCGTAKKLDAANARNQLLTNEVADLNNKIATNEKTIIELKAENAVKARAAEDCEQLKQQIMQNLKALNNALAEQGTSLRQIHKKAETALEKFYDAGAMVTYKDGLVYISLNDKLLFKSGSAVIGKDGRDALAVVAEVLNENPRVKIYVVGNTDDVLVKSGFKDNWSLSTERANAIVRIFLDDYKVEPARMTAAGRGKYNPVAGNATDEGRALNRRTDIILNPDLGSLFNN